MNNKNKFIQLQKTKADKFVGMGVHLFSRILRFVVCGSHHKK